MGLRIIMHEAFPQEDVAAARRIAADFDQSAEVDASYGTKSVDPVLAVFLLLGGQFASGFLGKAGEDAWDTLKTLVSRLRAESTRQSQLVIEDDEGLELILGPDTPDDALLRLPDDVRQAAGEAGQLCWDSTEHGWKAPF